MEIALLPGDRRQTILGELLQQDGYSVLPYQSGMSVDAYLFPLPTGAHPVLAELPAGALVLAGLPVCDRPELRLRDYYCRESVQLRNAEVTAEAALVLASEQSEDTLWDSRVLVLGYGRIGQALCRRLPVLGAEVTVYARREESLALARCRGLRALSRPPEEPFDFVFNTIPAPVLDTVPKGVCIELASAPGGFPELPGIIRAAGLPGRCAPHRGAQILHEAILTIFREEGLL